METPLLDAAMSIPSNEDTTIPYPNELDEGLKHYYEGRGMDASDLLWEAISAGEKAEEKHIKYLFSNLFINGRFMLREHSAQLLEEYSGDISDSLYKELCLSVTQPTEIDPDFCDYAAIFLDGYEREKQHKENIWELLIRPT